MHQNYLIYTPILAASLVLSLYILFRDSKNGPHRVLSALIFSLFVWVFCLLITDTTQDLSTALFWGRMAIIGPSFIPALFLCFTLVFPKVNLTVFRLITILLPALAFTVLSPTALNVEAVAIHGWGTEIFPGVLYRYLLAYFLVYFGLAFILLFQNYQNGPISTKNQIRYVFFGALIAVLLGLCTNLILIEFGLSQFSVLGPFSTLIFSAVTAYAIIKHRLIDISVVISRWVAELAAASIFSVIYLALAWGYKAFFANALNLPFIILTLIYGFMVAQYHLRVRLFIQTTSDKLILRGKYDYYQSLANVGLEINKSLSLENIKATLRRVFFEVMEVSNPRLFLPADFSRPEVKALIAEEIVFKGNDLVIPCRIENRLVALIALGKKLSEDAYTDEDLRLLNSLSSQVAVAIDHTRTYDEIKKELETAQVQLDRAQRLAALGTIAAGVAHEIRNPLTVIQTETDILVKAPKGVEELKTFQEKVTSHIKRATAIIRNMLNLTKSEKRVELPVDLNALIEATIGFFSLDRIVLRKELKPLSVIKGNPDELRQVLVNLIDNALAVMPEGGALGIKTYQTEGHVFIEVSDTGPGIAKENLSRIFDPFFSTRHDGAGLGLSIVYRIVREHGGKIEVKSPSADPEFKTTFILSF
ncbi:MAG: ATP-binding protein [Candidatus Margulisiibacteriota bacterium]|jgi:signal transduction histidine kinase